MKKIITIVGILCFSLLGFAESSHYYGYYENSDYTAVSIMGKIQADSSSPTQLLGKFKTADDKVVTATLIQNGKFVTGNLDVEGKKYPFKGTIDSHGVSATMNIVPYGYHFKLKLYPKAYVSNGFTHLLNPINPKYLAPFLNLVKPAASINLFSQRNTQDFSMWENKEGWLSSQVNGMFIAYRCLGNSGNHFYIAAIYSTGGTGVFSNLFEVKKHLGTLYFIKSITVGDRSSGAIESADMQGNVIKYSTYVTAKSLLAYANLSTAEQKRTETLSDSANFFVGTANYSYNILTQQKQVISYSLKSNAVRQDGLFEINRSIESLADQAFEETYNSYIQTGVDELTQNALNNFARFFLQRQ